MTHSPLSTALPGADVVEVGDHGMRRVRWEQLSWWTTGRYMDDPRVSLRHIAE